ncbi:eukaryotic translation initiation factor 4B isoform X2 [Anopheles cruzii]|uniref:eukaryotic translation initiation factor 4B isoform X2 n=1 Tax=Anopheles cruzii TaxID=68878 RepID=UPI0022EC94B0|nr:eukaryotic translation initiation factor 4B isoform X2 [Anopheles cruzii]
MASASGKKGKKTKKNNKLSLGEFLSDGNAGVLNQVQVSVPVKLNDWGDDGDDDDDERSVRTQVIALPTAPRATRIMNDDSVPQHPPYSIYVSNLPYDINDDDLYEFFPGMEIISMSLPRDDGDSRRLRGFGNIEFASRNDLIDVLAMPEPIIRNRRIRIGLYNENDTKRRNNRYDNFGGGESDRGSDNWRERPEGSFAPRSDAMAGVRRFNSNFNREREDRPDTRGNWRSADRPLTAPLSPHATRRYGDRDRDAGGFMRRNMDRIPRRDDAPMERPKLVLQPRTLPLPEMPKLAPEQDLTNDRRTPFDGEGGGGAEETVAPRPKSTPVPAAKVFGDAKPVDTAAREREIEERLREKERLEREERQRKRAEASSLASEEGRTELDKENVGVTQNSSKHKAEGDAPAPEVISWRVRNDDDKDDRKIDNHRDERDNRPILRNTGGQDYQRKSSDRDTSEEGFDGGRFDDATLDSSGVDDEECKNIIKNDRQDISTEKSFEEDEQRDPEVLEERMSEFQEPSGSNLSVANTTFPGLSADDEIDD